MTEPEILAPGSAVFVSAGEKGLVLRTAGRPDRVVTVRPMFPVSNPGKFISVYCEDVETGIVPDISLFPREQRELLGKELEHQYLVPRILEIRSITDGTDYSLWDTVTDHGARKFYVKSRSENIHSRGRSRAGGVSRGIIAGGMFRLFITDMENCRYQIEDWRKLPRASRQFLDKVI